MNITNPLLKFLEPICIQLIVGMNNISIAFFYVYNNILTLQVTHHLVSINKFSDLCTKQVIVTMTCCKCHVIFFIRRMVK